MKTMMRAAAFVVTMMVVAGPSRAETTSSTTDKAAISKACTDQANAKGLHGAARKKFRSECKKNGGKV